MAFDHSDPSSQEKIMEIFETIKACVHANLVSHGSAVTVSAFNALIIDWLADSPASAEMVFDMIPKHRERMKGVQYDD